MIRRLAASVAALAVAALAVGSPAAAAPRPSNPQGATVSLAASTARAGATLRFSGTGWKNQAGRGQVVTIKLDDVDILRDVTASDSGAISGSVTIPARTGTGQHWLRFLAGSGAENDGPARSLASAMLTVTAGSSGGATPTATGTAAPSTGGTLPKTGIDAGGWLAGALLLPAAGAALLVADRRRRRSAA
ncbi:hypothetical protein [Spirilliplanes yamanashiensis]|uniref:Gram-positive cocci surface proteins LPxTG domain-containing protein n=1 Tax=Spirilliplanes yamanashiensis TaxID=42233 RepID=A0A8J3Y6U4_9ACTN|nr:hypothetical protein [Spirilliplanes yamanashiensis]MDP9814763.1 hypothetical protein [Spirilliplanes yamanashiensis]GIJ02417.1 hypothetical protein Sya03_17690 [Spirilliplanes yamanashiensis]